MRQQDSEATKTPSKESCAGPSACGRSNFTIEFSEGRWSSITTKADDNVPRKNGCVDELARDGTSPPTKSVPDDSVTALGGNDNAHPICIGWASVHDHMIVDVLVPAPDHLTKIAWLNDSVVAGKHRLELNGDFATALATTSRKNCATRTGSHAQTEAVNLRSTAVVGLVGTLRHLFSSASGRHSQGDGLRTGSATTKE